MLSDKSRNKLDRNKHDYKHLGKKRRELASKKSDA